MFTTASRLGILSQLCTHSQSPLKWKISKPFLELSGNQGIQGFLQPFLKSTWSGRSSVILNSHSRALRVSAQTGVGPPSDFDEFSSEDNSGSQIQCILGIETSCDDTGAALVSLDGEILAEALSSQASLLAEWGGVVPALAAGAHEGVIDRVISEVFAQAKIPPSAISAVAVTIGPGLSLCLKVGVVKARAIARKFRKPFIPIHHMEAHALIARQSSPGVSFPFLCLLVSGGHNLVLLARGIGDYSILGTTLDDALGEAYDKVARLLCLDLREGGGGRAVEAAAKRGNERAVNFKVPMRHVKSCDFSYAGLKSNVARFIESKAEGMPAFALDLKKRRKKIETFDPTKFQGVESSEIFMKQDEGSPDSSADNVEVEKLKADIAASFQFVAVQHLREKTERAIEETLKVHPEIRHLVVSGGVASNQHVRSQLGELSEKYSIELVCPPPRLCTDNGVMVAWAGVEYFKNNWVQPPPPLDETEETKVELRPRWPLGERFVPSLSPSLPPHGIRSAKKKGLAKPLSPPQASSSLPTLS